MADTRALSEAPRTFNRTVESITVASSRSEDFGYCPDTWLSNISVHHCWASFNFDWNP